MNRTKTTSTARRLRHAALALVALVALAAASCTADPLDGTDTPNAGNTNPDDVLTFAVAPRPGFTAVPVSGQGTAAPATRATQTDNATCWEQGDILWIQADFFQDKQNLAAPNVTSYTSALKYDGTEWRYLTEAEAKDLNTGNIPGFTRLLRWPRESKDWPAPGMFIAAYYTGSGTPDADGTLTINPKGEIPITPFIVGRSGICSPDVQPVPLKFIYEYISRIRIPAGYKVELTEAGYWSTIGFSIDKDTDVKREPITEIPAQLKDTDVFLTFDGDNDVTAKLTRDNISCTFTFSTITDEYGNSVHAGASYTLPPYTSGTQTPVAGYDLTVATETELRELARAVNAGEKLPNGKPAAEARVLQTANIELTKEWTPIGSGFDKPFRGAYNGNGNEITGLTIRTAPQPGVPNWSNVGLFGYAEGAVLTGINLLGVEIDFTESNAEIALYVGSIAGWLESSTLSLCSATGKVNAGGGAEKVCAGGITGNTNYSTISRCRADVETKAATTFARGGAYAGGITGTNNMCSFLLSCEVLDKAVTADGDGGTYAGGITGLNDTANLIAFCRTGGNTVEARNATGQNYAGGLVGVNNGSLYSCYSRATAVANPVGAGAEWAGAIVGNNDILQGNVQHCYGAGAADQGTSNLDPTGNIFYETNPGAGEIFGVMINYSGKVESLTDPGTGTSYYPFTTHLNPSATPAYGIIPQRAVWKKGAWKDDGSDPNFPEIDYDYEGGD